MRQNNSDNKIRTHPLPLRLEGINAQAWQGEQLLKLTPRAFAVLHYLVERPSQLVTKDELMQTVWADTMVTDGALAAAIRELRKALCAKHSMMMRRGRSTLRPCIGGGIGSLEK